MKIAILGFGREGKAVLKFLQNRGLTRISTRKNAEFKDAEFWVLDSNSKIKLPKNIYRQVGKNYLKNLNQFNIIFRSPGVPYNLPEIKQAIKKGVKISSGTQLFFEQLRGKTQNERGTTRKGIIKIIGITGTKGKGTTATLLYKILKACGKKVFLAGNIGRPAIDIIPRLPASSLRKSAIIIILELSSFQLQDLRYSPHIAAVLDIFPDHLDAHKNLKEYISAKRVIAKFQNPNDKLFYFARSQYAKDIARKSRGRKIAIALNNFKLLSSLDLKMPGLHNFKNVAMAASIALSLGCPKNKIIRVVKNFRGNEHRLELVKTIRVYQRTCSPRLRESEARLRQSTSIQFYNDSASTNPQTAAAAILSFKEPNILIAGGKDKNLNYKPLAQALKKSNTKFIALYGENKKKIRRQIAKSKTRIVLKKNLESAVNFAYKTVKSLVASGYTLKPIIVFSPASASFDMFKDYQDRGEKFKEIVRKLK